MVKMYLKNIEESNRNLAHYECHPEGKEEDKFTITIDFQKKEMIYFSLTEMDNYVFHAKYRLLKAYEETGKIPTEEMSMWY